MKRLSSLLMLFVFSALWVPAQAGLIEIHEDQLLKSCKVLKVNPSDISAAACATYINGFLDGALITDSENAVEMEQISKGSFMDRALKTRLGPKENQRDFLHFCIPVKMEKADVIEKLAHYLPQNSEGVNRLKAFIYQGLKAEFPC